MLCVVELAEWLWRIMTACARQASDSDMATPSTEFQGLAAGHSTTALSGVCLRCYDAVECLHLSQALHGCALKLDKEHESSWLCHWHGLLHYGLYTVLYSMHASCGCMH